MDLSNALDRIEAQMRRWAVEPGRLREPAPISAEPAVESVCWEQVSRLRRSHWSPPSSDADDHQAWRVFRSAGDEALVQLLGRVPLVAAALVIEFDADELKAERYAGLVARVQGAGAAYACAQGCLAGLHGVRLADDSPTVDADSQRVKSVVVQLATAIQVRAETTLLGHEAVELIWGVLRDLFHIVGEATSKAHRDVLNHTLTVLAPTLGSLAQTGTDPLPPRTRAWVRSIMAERAAVLVAAAWSVPQESSAYSVLTTAFLGVTMDVFDGEPYELPSNPADGWDTALVDAAGSLVATEAARTGAPPDWFRDRWAQCLAEPTSWKWDATAAAIRAQRAIWLLWIATEALRQPPLAGTDHAAKMADGMLRDSLACLESWLWDALPMSPGGHDHDVLRSLLPHLARVSRTVGVRTVLVEMDRWTSTEFGIRVLADIARLDAPDLVPALEARAAVRAACSGVLGDAEP